MLRSAPFVLLCLAAAGARADVVLPHLGRLLNAADEPATGNVTVSFKLFRYAEPPPEGADESFWEESYAVTLTNGHYQVDLGRTSSSGTYEGKKAIADAAFDGKDRYLQLAVDGTQLRPRLRVGVAPYSLRAASAALADKATLADRATLADKATAADRAALADKATAADSATEAARAAQADNAARLGDRAPGEYALATSLGAYVKKQGDAISGNLSVAGTPAAANDVVTKGWVEQKLEGYVSGSAANIDAATLGGFAASAFYRPGQLFRLASPPSGFVCSAQTVGAIWMDESTGDLRVCSPRDGKSSATAARSCQALVDGRFQVETGPYWIDVDGPSGGRAPFRTICDFSKPGEGWTRVVHAVMAPRTFFQVGEAAALAGAGDAATANANWVGVSRWRELLAVGQLRVTCSGGAAGAHDVTGDFTINPSDAWRISYAPPVQNCFSQYHSGLQLTATDQDRDPWTSNCASYTGTESSGWGWHRSCHCGSPWFGDDGQPFCVVKAGNAWGGGVGKASEVNFYLR